MFKIDNTRMGIEKDSGSNYVLRGYFYTSNDIKKSNWHTEHNKKNFYNLNLMINLIYYTLVKQLKIEDDTFIPTRIQVFYNSKDDFFSIVMGFKISKKHIEKVDIGKLRYYFGIFCAKANIHGFYISGYDTHKNYASWDEQHISEGPVLDFEKVDCKKIFEDIVIDFEDLFVGGNINE